MFNTFSAPLNKSDAISTVRPKGFGSSRRLLKKPLPVPGRSVVRSRDARRRSAIADRDVQLRGVGRADSSGSSAAWGEEAGGYGLGQNDEGLRWAVLGGGAAIDSA